MGKFKNGHDKKGGRQKGSVNVLTKTVKETVLQVFNLLQSDPKHNLTAFAKHYPKEFYMIAAKLIPTEVTGKDGANLIPPIQIIVQDSEGSDTVQKLIQRSKSMGSSN